MNGDFRCAIRVLGIPRFRASWSARRARLTDAGYSYVYGLEAGTQSLIALGSSIPATEAETQWPPFCGRDFKFILLCENCSVWIKLSLRFVPVLPFDKRCYLVQIMAWHWTCLHAYVYIWPNRPQWVLYHIEAWTKWLPSWSRLFDVFLTEIFMCFDEVEKIYVFAFPFISSHLDGVYIYNPSSWKTSTT